MPVFELRVDIGACPFDEIADHLPDKVWLAKGLHGLYGCFHYTPRQVHGLAAFISKECATEFSSVIGPMVKPEETTFEEARQIAKERGGRINAVLVLDAPQGVLIHYVK